MASRDTEFEKGIGTLVNSADRAFKKAVNRSTRGRTTRGGPAREFMPRSGGIAAVLNPPFVSSGERFGPVAVRPPVVVRPDPSQVAAPVYPQVVVPLPGGGYAGQEGAAPEAAPPASYGPFAIDLRNGGFGFDFAGEASAGKDYPAVVPGGEYAGQEGAPRVLDLSGAGGGPPAYTLTDDGDGAYPDVPPQGPYPDRREEFAKKIIDPLVREATHAIFPDPGESMQESEDPRKQDRVEPGFSMQELQEDRMSRDRSVLPGTTPREQPIVAPGTEPPELDVSGLPGTSSETASGALSLDDYMKRMKEMYPDIDFTNPKQAQADANARRDLDRTAMLAQLALAAGMTKGAGPSWAGMGEGFEGAGAAYDKGFTKYQQALQDSADRYQKQQESQIVYDTARRKAAIDLYTSSTEQDREDRRTAWKEISQRKFDYWKEQQTTSRKDMELDRASIDKIFQKQLDLIPKPPEGSLPEDIAEYEKKRAAVSATWAASIRQGEIVQPQYNGVNIGD